MSKVTRRFFNRELPAGWVWASLLFIGLAGNQANATYYPTCDRITGGGFIYTASGAKATFAVNFGRNAKNELFVQVNFIDHGVGGPRIKATGITSYTRVGTDPGKRRVTGTATNAAGTLLTFAVIVDDNGEPDNTDTFAITLENGYKASGVLGGGNIQLHKQCRPDGGPNRF